nr:MAG TPA: hypothetical protein [Caudoviricetes sp.]
MQEWNRKPQGLRLLGVFVLHNLDAIISLSLLAL